MRSTREIYDVNINADSDKIVILYNANAVCCLASSLTFCEITIL